jgi:hypothetical protein
MRSKTPFATILIFLLIGLLLVPLVALAAETSANHTRNADSAFELAAVAQQNQEANDEEAPQGIALGILLLGIGGVAIVGLAMIARDNFRGESELTE